MMVSYTHIEGKMHIYAKRMYYVWQRMKMKKVQKEMGI